MRLLSRRLFFSPGGFSRMFAGRAIGAGEPAVWEFLENRRLTGRKPRLQLPPCCWELRNSNLCRTHFQLNGGFEKASSAGSGTEA